MDEDGKAVAKIEELAHGLADVICDASNSTAAAEKLLQIACHVMVVKTRIIAMSPDFKNRIERQRLARAEADLQDRRMKLTEQLSALGIPAAPIFQDSLEGDDS